MTKLADGSETEVSPLVIQVMENCGIGLSSNVLAIGKRFVYEDNDWEPHVVEITSGEYMGLRGLSNHWWWREVLADGSLSESEENGCSNGTNGRRFSPIDEQTTYGSRKAKPPAPRRCAKCGAPPAPMPDPPRPPPMQAGVCSPTMGPRLATQADRDRGWTTNVDTIW